MKRCLPLLLLLSFFTLQLARAEATANATLTAESFYNDPEIIGRYNQLSPEQQQKFLEGYPFLTHHHLVQAASFIFGLIFGSILILSFITLGYYTFLLQDNDYSRLMQTLNENEKKELTQKKNTYIIYVLISLAVLLVTGIFLWLTFYFYKNHFAIGDKEKEENRYFLGGGWLGYPYLLSFFKADSFLRTLRIGKMKQLLDKLETEHLPLLAQ